MKFVEQSELTERQKRVWLLRHRDGLTPQEIARQLHIQLPAVFKILVRARERMSTRQPIPRRTRPVPHRRWVRPTSLSRFNEL